MEIGNGIAIAGVWIFAGLVFSSPATSALGSWIGLICAVAVTFWLK